MRILSRKNKKAQVKLGHKKYNKTRLRFAFQTLMALGETIARGFAGAMTMEEIHARSGLEEDITHDVMTELVRMGIWQEYKEKYFVPDID